MGGYERELMGDFERVGVHSLELPVKEWPMEEFEKEEEKKMGEYQRVGDITVKDLTEITKVCVLQGLREYAEEIKATSALGIPLKQPGLVYQEKSVVKQEPASRPLTDLMQNIDRAERARWISEDGTFDLGKMTTFQMSELWLQQIKLPEYLQLKFYRLKS